MQTNQPIEMAQGVAMLRAAHQVMDTPRVFDDPLALAIVGPEGRAQIESRRGDSWFETSRSFRAFTAVRSRYAEDELAEAARRGVGQYVILGAGLDTYAYRPGRVGDGPRVFEVDHPQTQAWKRARLGEAGIAAPESLAFAPVDFATESLAGGLARAGFRRDEPAFFSFLGVAVFLEAPAVTATLRFVADQGAGSGIVLDYGVTAELLDEQARAQREAGMRWAAAKGEPWLTFLDPAALADDLRGMGFTHLENLGRRELNDRYFHGRTDWLGPPVGARRIMSARR